MSQEEKIQDLVDKLGVDIDVSSETDVELESGQGQTELNTKQITVIQPVDPESAEVAVVNRQT